MSWWTRWMTQSPAWRRVARHVFRHRCAILMYHGVVPSPLHVFNWCHIPASLFRAQMMYLKAHYRVVPLDEVVSRMEQGRPWPEHAACITFDDAFRSVLDFAYPILQELELPFTVFAVTCLTETGLPPWPEQLYSAMVHTGVTTLTWHEQHWKIATPADRGACYRELVEQLGRMSPEQRDTAMSELLQNLGRTGAQSDPLFATLRRDELRRLTADGLCHIGAHSETHAVLTHCDAARLEREVKNARQGLCGEHGYVDIFAYPHGQYDAQVMRVVKDAGFRAAVTVNHRMCSPSDSPFELPRIGIGAGMNLDAFAGTLLAI